MKTSTKPPRVRASDLNPAWRVVDAEGKTLGRLSSEIAILLQGKHKPIYVPNLNTGDFVIVINAEKVIVTGRKLEQKIYYRHSGYHGGLKEQTLAELMSKKPTQAIRQAVKGMLPKNIIGRRMLARLKLYAGASHPHEAQMNARPSTDEAGHGAETPDKTLVKKALSTSKPDATPQKRTTPKRKEPVGASMQVAAPKKRTGAKKSQLTAEVADTPQLGKSQGTLKSEFTKGRTRPRKPKPAVESSGVTEDKQAEPSKVQETEDA